MLRGTIVPLLYLEGLELILGRLTIDIVYTVEVFRYL